ncbi:hypothetical protein REPUB_Repub20aG0104900 [Reevesia pubescens]
MASLLSFSICFLVFFHGCFAQIDLITNRGQSQRGQQQQSRQRCQLQSLNALQPKHCYKSKAGVTEFWDQNEEQFQCAGVAFLCHIIQQNGLLLPSFNNAPQLIYVVEGNSKGDLPRLSRHINHNRDRVPGISTRRSNNSNKVMSLPYQLE